MSGRRRARRATPEAPSGGEALSEALAREAPARPEAWTRAALVVFALFALALAYLGLRPGGVGPLVIYMEGRLALALLSGLGAPRLQEAIATGDVTALVSAPGVGRRTAGRIVLELKGKLEASEAGVGLATGGDDSEVIAALTALGYSPNEARQAVGNSERTPNLTLEDRVRLALQQFGGSG